MSVSPPAPPFYLENDILASLDEVLELEDTGTQSHCLEGSHNHPVVDRSPDWEVEIWCTPLRVEDCFVTAAKLTDNIWLNFLLLLLANINFSTSKSASDSTLYFLSPNFSLNWLIQINYCYN